MSHWSGILAGMTIVEEIIILILIGCCRLGSPLDIPITSPAMQSPANMPAPSPASNVIAASPYHAQHGKHSPLPHSLVVHDDSLLRMAAHVFIHFIQENGLGADCFYYIFMYR